MFGWLVQEFRERRKARQDRKKRVRFLKDAARAIRARDIQVRIAPHNYRAGFGFTFSFRGIHFEGHCEVEREERFEGFVYVDVYHHLMMRNSEIADEPEALVLMKALSWYVKDEREREAERQRKENLRYQTEASIRAREEAVAEKRREIEWEARRRRERADELHLLSEALPTSDNGLASGRVSMVERVGALSFPPKQQNGEVSFAPKVRQ
jgi:hypothetical protein